MRLEGEDARTLGGWKAVGWALAHQLTLTLVGQGPPYWDAWKLGRWEAGLGCRQELASVLLPSVLAF